MRALAKILGLQLIDVYSLSELELMQNIYYFNGIKYTDKDFLEAITYYLPAINKDANSLSWVITYNSYSPVDAKFGSMNLIQYFNSN